jgi:hypothetical protein
MIASRRDDLRDVVELEAVGVLAVRPLPDQHAVRVAHQRGVEERQPEVVAERTR